ncbi:probable adenylate kinase 7, mitochondrial isoform X1 [Camellia sinensis]|uniref:probable adenylate kinase 7, mitochondrial isoform X1 n=1 Tax=Camellia sinensis TaxID=4442 RepID=UPI001036B81F|nr:probable adenylate kinase 7, mitochondrial isoform X1 [Camellia sinensis]
MAGICRLKASAAALSHLKAVAAPPLMQLFLRLVTTRSYGAAAQPQPQQQQQLEHDYYEAESNSGGLAPMVDLDLDSDGSLWMRGVQWVFIGNPGAKKHVYADKLSKLLQVPHISMASLVRQDLSPRSPLYQEIANSVNQGKLVPEEIIFGLLSKRLEDGYYKGETGFILDGIPRTQIQAEILDKLIDIDLVVNFKCTKDCLLEHHGDSIFSHPHQSDHFSSSASATLDMASQDTRSKYSFCNTESAWKGKAHFYAKQMKPVEDYYKKQKKLIDFQVGSAPRETWQGLLATLHLQHINAAHSRLTSGSNWL